MLVPLGCTDKVTIGAPEAAGWGEQAVKRMAVMGLQQIAGEIVPGAYTISLSNTDQN